MYLVSPSAASASSVAQSKLPWARNGIECLVEAATERVRVKDDDQKRPRKSAAAVPQDARHERKADR